MEVVAAVPHPDAINSTGGGKYVPHARLHRLQLAGDRGWIDSRGRKGSGVIRGTGPPVGLSSMPIEDNHQHGSSAAAASN
eukprot:SAG31_NODE_26822_length_436_cov_0.593472_1_plen_79_part_01